MKKSLKKQKPIKFCPKCRSVNIEKPITALTALGVNNPFRCKECGYQSYIFPEVIKKIKNQKITEK